MTVPLIGPNGRKYQVDESKLDAAVKAGYRVESADAPQSLLESVKETATDIKEPLAAGAIGALQGATAGAFGAVVGETAAHETKAAVLRAMEQNPLASAAGEFAGMVASPLNALVPGIEGPRAATALGRLGQKVVSGGTLGALYGAGHTVSESALGDTQLTAEKLLAGAGLGAVLGGLGGGVGGAIEEGAARFLPKLATVIRGSQSALDDVADHFALKSFRNTKNELSKFTDEQLAAVAKVARERGHLSLTPEGMGKSIADDVVGVGKTKGAFLDAADAAAVKPDFAAALKALDDRAAAMSPLERESIAGTFKKARTALEDIATDPKLGTWRAFDKWKQDLQAMAKFSRGAAEDDLALGLKRQLAGAAREEIDRQLVPALGAEGAKFLESKALYGALKDAERLAAKGSMRPGGFSLSDLGAAAIGTNLHPAGLIGALGNKFVREHGAAVAAQIADRLAKSPTMKAVAASFATALPGTAPQLGRYGPALLTAAQRSPELALAQHIVVAQADPEYAATAQLAGLTPEQPDEQAAALTKATNLAATHAALKSQDHAIREALEHVVKGTKPAASTPAMKTQDFGAKRMRQDSAESFKRRVEEIRDLASSPAMLAERAAKNLTAFGAVAPAVSAMMTAASQRAVTYLAQQAEMPPKPGPLAREWVPSQAQRHAFTLKLDAVQNPFSILGAAARGTLVKSQVEAVRAVYPTLAREMEMHAMEQMASGAKMSYRARQMLNVLTGIDPDGTMSPKAIAANQRTFAMDQAKPSAQLGETDGQDLGDAGRMATPGQRKELAAEVS